MKNVTISGQSHLDVTHRFLKGLCEAWVKSGWHQPSPFWQRLTPPDSNKLAGDWLLNTPTYMSSSLAKANKAAVSSKNKV